MNYPRRLSAAPFRSIRCVCALLTTEFDSLFMISVGWNSIPMENACHASNNGLEVNSTKIDYAGVWSSYLFGLGKMYRIEAERVADTR